MEILISLLILVAVVAIAVWIIKLIPVPFRSLGIRILIKLITVLFLILGVIVLIKLFN